MINNPSSLGAPSSPSTLGMGVYGSLMDPGQTASELSEAIQQMQQMQETQQLQQRMMQQQERESKQAEQGPDQTGNGVFEALANMSPFQDQVDIGASSGNMLMGNLGQVGRGGGSASPLSLLGGFNQLG